MKYIPFFIISLCLIYSTYLFTKKNDAVYFAHAKITKVEKSYKTSRRTRMIVESQRVSKIENDTVTAVLSSPEINSRISGGYAISYPDYIKYKEQIETGKKFLVKFEVPDPTETISERSVVGISVVFSAVYLLLLFFLLIGVLLGDSVPLSLFFLITPETD